MFQPSLPAAYGQTIEVQVPQRARMTGWRPYYSQTPLTRLLEALGSVTNPYPFTLIQGSVNGLKGRVAYGNAATADAKIQSAMRAAEAGDSARMGEIFGYLRQVSTALDWAIY
jgi:hypothetical protein